MPIESAPRNSAAPLRFEVWKKKLSPNEKLVLLAMFEHSKTGEWMYASLGRIAAYCSLSRSTVRRILHGDQKRATIGLICRRVVAPIAAAKPGRRRPATYRLQPDAAPDDPRVLEFLGTPEQQPMVFPEDEIAIRDWIKKHGDAWAQTIAQVTAAAPNLVRRHISESERLGFFRNIALQNGMPARLAECAFAPTSWRPEGANGNGKN